MAMPDRGHDRLRLARVAGVTGLVLLLHAAAIDRLAAWWPDTARQPAPIRRIELVWARPLPTAAADPAPEPRAARAAARDDVRDDAPDGAAVPRLKTLRQGAPAPPALDGQALAAAPSPALVEAVDPVAPMADFADIAATLPQLDWPPSMQLDYRLRGHYRGAMEGSSQVAWVRTGTRYQVQMDVVVGLPILPLMSRRITSEGELGPYGLRPRRYDERSRIGPAAPSEARLVFGSDGVRLADGRLRPAPVGLQDSASQFVQLAWLFNLQPQRLRAGERIELALALPRRIGRWVYEVQAEESVETPFGPVAAHALRPQASSARAGELAVQLWIAPSLHHLPVRMRIEQPGSDAHVDLLLQALPRTVAVPAADEAGSERDGG